DLGRDPYGDEVEAERENGGALGLRIAGCISSKTLDEDELRCAEPLRGDRKHRDRKNNRQVESCGPKGGLDAEREHHEPLRKQHDKDMGKACEAGLEMPEHAKL